MNFTRTIQYCNFTLRLLFLMHDPVELALLHEAALLPPHVVLVRLQVRGVRLLAVVVGRQEGEGLGALGLHAPAFSLHHAGGLALAAAHEVLLLDEVAAAVRGAHHAIEALGFRRVVELRHVHQLHHAVVVEKTLLRLQVVVPR